MKTRVKKFSPGGFYCLQGHATANSLFFEDKFDQQLFIRMLDRFLGELIEVNGLSTNPTGWNLFFTVKDAETIKRVYKKLKNKSRKAQDSKRIVEPEKMLSEHFRYFLSAYVKQSNFRHERHGARVHSKMEKYVFESLEDLEAEIEDMREMKETNLQKQKYRPNMRHYLVEKQLKRESVWRHSFVGISGEKLIKSVLPCFQWVLHRLDVVRQLILSTWTFHFGPNNAPFSPPKLE